MMSSDSQAMGRVGEVIIRTWQTAHKMKVQRGALRRRLARATTTFASSATSPSTRSTRRIANGIAHEVGSIEVGKWADLVLWKPAFFGVKPSLILKGGFIAAAAMGDPNASIPTPQPVHMPADVRLRSAARWRARPLSFVSQAALQQGVAEGYGLRKRLAAVKNVRAITKAADGAQRVRAEDGDRRADLQRACRRRSCSPASRPPVLPMAQRYFLF